jgi:hypothetical protein
MQAGRRIDQMKTLRDRAAFLLSGLRWAPSMAGMACCYGEHDSFTINH